MAAIRRIYRYIVITFAKLLFRKEKRKKSENRRGDTCIHAIFASVLSLSVIEAVVNLLVLWIRFCVFLHYFVFVFVISFHLIPFFSLFHGGSFSVSEEPNIQCDCGWVVFHLYFLFFRLCISEFALALFQNTRNDARMFCSALKYAVFSFGSAIRICQWDGIVDEFDCLAWGKCNEMKWMNAPNKICYRWLDSFLFYRVSIDRPIDRFGTTKMEAFFPSIH